LTVTGGVVGAGLGAGVGDVVEPPRGGAEPLGTVVLGLAPPEEDGGLGPPEPAPAPGVIGLPY